MPRTTFQDHLDFRRLWWLSAITNLGDGALLAAGPLLVASLTGDPVAVAGAAFAQQVPWLLFALTSGALVDRLPRRALVAVVNSLRAAVLGGLAVALLLDAAQLWLVYLVSFLLGTGETLADTAYGALVANSVPRDLLGRAYARLNLTGTIGNQLVGPPLGAVMFAAVAALPFGFHALVYALGAVLVTRVAGTPVVAREPATLIADVREGVRWLLGNPALRVLALCILVMNLTGVGAFALWVLYAEQRLGLTGFGFGLFIAAGAVGGVVGSGAYGFLERRFGHVLLLRAGLVLESLTYPVLALLRDPWLAGAVMALFGVHAVVWGSVSTTVRQTLTPDHLRGRVGSTYQLASVGGSALGALGGGLLARHLGLLAPFWLAGAAVAAVTALAWHPLRTARVEPSRP
ncbi:MFS transporter [Saccharothrix syringae]|uniref:MFS transporter n=1 Tax=Saccharothrix syringae TaxID=103733 RepID=A0A5Q0H8R5_SACSY|nr:MFS transporter [Saccharothrix syringae]QFZ22617.1 MFS transporter [Saccharothrix syringae]